MTILQTTDLKSPTYRAALNIRRVVFVQEQHVPENMEVDADEAKSIYFLLVTDGHFPAATLRLLPQGTDLLVQRVAVLKPFRKQGLGAQLMQAAIDYAQNHQADTLTLHAQVQAQDFYKKLGFKTTQTPKFEEAGIMHQEMQIKLH